MAGYLNGKKVLLGVTGSIAAYKAASLARTLMTAGADVTTILSEAATRFITPLTFEALTTNNAYIDGDLWHGPRVLHVDLAKKADMILVAPATQDLLARVAAGRANDLLSLVIAAFDGPVGICPAMHTAMWQSRASRNAVRQLRAFGYEVLDPVAGPLSSGDTGPGRLPGEDVLLAFAESLVAPKDLAGVRILVTTGPTREPIDPVRMLTNPSSGKMGFALAGEAHARGADVTVIAGPVHLDPPPFVRVQRVRTAMDMADAVDRELDTTDILLMCAAVVDFAPLNPAKNKLEKDGFEGVIRLKRTPDILLSVTSRDDRPFVVGFAAQTDRLPDKAKKKMKRKHPDLLFANIVGQDTVFGQDMSEGLLLWPDGRYMDVTARPKRDVARLILDEAQKALNAK